MGGQCYCIYNFFIYMLRSYALAKIHNMHDMNTNTLNVINDMDNKRKHFKIKKPCIEIHNMSFLTICKRMFTYEFLLEFENVSLTQIPQMMQHNLK